MAVARQARRTTATPRAVGGVDGSFLRACARGSGVVAMPGDRWRGVNTAAATPSAAAPRSGDRGTHHHVEGLAARHRTG